MDFSMYVLCESYMEVGPSKDSELLGSEAESLHCCHEGGHQEQGCIQWHDVHTANCYNPA